MSEFTWQQYWSKETDGGHRYQNENFLKKEAKEKLFHLDGGNSLLDFGCGSGDLLIYFIPEYKEITGVDFSLSMLEKAQEKIQRSGFTNVKLIHTDDVSMWEKIDRPFDRIINSQVLQYLTITQIESYIKNASKKIDPDGKIIFFDIIDSRLYDLWKAGLFSKDSQIIKVFLRVLKIKILNIFKPEPKDIIGYSYDPNVIENIAQKFGFQMEYVESMYYEYRYHAILSKIKR